MIGLSSIFLVTPALANEAEKPAESISQEAADPQTSTEGQDPEAPAEEDSESPTPPEPQLTDEEADAQLEGVQTLGEAGVEVVAVGINAAGETVVVKTQDSADTPEAEAAIEAFVDTQGEVNEVVVTKKPQAFADGDVVGGAGYASLSGELAYACSIGFTGWTPTGGPALIGAGHCAFNEDVKHTNTTLTIPSEEPAVGGEGYGFPASPVLLGTWGFAQHGGPNGTAGAANDPDSTDIAVIDVNEAAEWNLLPEVTDWTTAGNNLDSLADSTVEVKSVGAAAAGSVSKSGRTTGFTTGSITGDHIVDGWSEIGGAWVRGFSSDVEAAPGDSGGSVIQGNTAVGVISGGLTPEENEGTQWTWSTSIQHGLSHTGGYTVALDIDAPIVTSPASGSTVEVGATITGTATGAAEVAVSTAPNTGASIPVSDGNWSFAAANEPGTYSYTLTAVNGFNRSEATTYEITVVAEVIDAPVIASPADGSTVTTPVTVVSGTGIAGATVTLTGDATGTATVDANGNWSVDGLDLGYGSYAVSASQELDGESSTSAQSAFSVVPAAPVVTSINDGDTFAFDKSPTGVSGTGIEGATIEVVFGSTTYETMVVDGEWSIDFHSAPGAGSYELSATQTIDGVTSSAAQVSFVVETAAETPTTPTEPGDEDLANTGGSSLLPFGAAAAGMLLLGAAAAFIAARRKKANEVLLSSMK